MNCRSNSMKTLVLGTLATVTIGCKAPPRHPVERSQTRPTLSEREEIFASCTDYLTTKPPWSNYWGNATSAQFLSVDGQDPSPELITRILSQGSNFLPVSKCNRTFKGVFEKSSGKAARLYDLNLWELQAGTNAKVNCSLRSVGWGGLSITLQVELKAGNWVVTAEGKIMKG